MEDRSAVVTWSEMGRVRAEMGVCGLGVVRGKEWGEVA